MVAKNANPWSNFYFYRPQTKLWKGNVFTPVCDSVHRSGASGQTPPGRALSGTPPGQTTWADTPLGRHPPPEMATAADGTHPTGMHSCIILQFSFSAKICQIIGLYPPPTPPPIGIPVWKIVDAPLIYQERKNRELTAASCHTKNKKVFIVSV